MTAKHPVRGQALVETQLLAAFLLVPMLVWGPMLGKYLSGVSRIEGVASDIVWEQTVWASEDENLGTVTGLKIDGGESSSLALREPEAIRKWVHRAATGSGIDAIDSADSASKGQFDRAYWKYRFGDGERRIFGELAQKGNEETEVGTLGYEILGTYDSVVKGVKKIPVLGEALGGFGGLNHPLDARFNDEFSIAMRPPATNSLENYLDSPQAFRVSAGGQLISRQWSTQDTSHFRERAADFIPASIIQRSPIFQTFMEIVTYKLPSFNGGFIRTPEVSVAASLAPLKYELGAIDVAGVPDFAPNCKYGVKKTKSGGTSGTPFGLCRFEED